MRSLSKIKIKEILTRGVADVIVRRDLEKKLSSGKELRVKHGVDPTSLDLHLGQAVVYEKMRALQDMGHKIIFLIGDFTGRFGDPTEKLEVRRLRTKKEVRDIAKNYLKQVGKILNLKKTEIRYNSEWYDKMRAEEFIRLFSHFTVRRMLERDMFREREKRHLDIRLHEPLYPVLQAFDSVMLKSNLTIIGTDQLFNELQARELQKDFQQAPQDIIAMKILVGTDGERKMSQSLGNYIGITDPPDEQYGKIMSIPDHLIIDYFELVTRVSLRELDKINKALKNKAVNPRDLKARLAREVVSIFHSGKDAQRAEGEFNRVFKKHELPSRMPVVKLKKGKCPILDLLVKTKLAPSKSEAQRLVSQNAIKIDGETFSGWQGDLEVKDGMVIQAGKRHFIKIKT